MPQQNPHAQIISEIRGKIGQWVYARDPGGPLRRPWQEHRTMTSPAQQAQQDTYAVTCLRWSANLSDAQRTAWRAFADQIIRNDSLKQSYRLSGQNAHNMCNLISYRFAGTFIDDPPADLHCHQPTSVEILTATETPQALSVHMQGALDADEYWVLSATPLTPLGTYNVTRLWRPLDFAADALPFTYDAIAEYTAKFSALTAGKKVHVKFQIANVATGTISRPVITSLEVT